MHLTEAVIAASLIVSPSFAQQRQRLGRPESLLDNVDNIILVSKGKTFDEDVGEGLMFSGRHFDSELEEGADDSKLLQQIQLQQDVVDNEEEEGTDVAQAARQLSQSQCSNNKHKFVLEITTDENTPGDNVFKVHFNGSRVMKKGPFSRGGVTTTFGMCLSQGKLVVTAIDRRGDGMSDGTYRITIDGNDVAGAPDSEQWGRRVHTFNIGSSSMSATSAYSGSNRVSAQSSYSNSNPTNRPTEKQNDYISGRSTCFAPRTSEEYDYWVEHNARRRKYHSMYGVDFKPLGWSNELADESTRYANELLQFCCTSTLKHDETNIHHGENLASSCGTRPGAKSADEVVSRWVENEHQLENYREKLHYTQVLWRSTSLVGCGVAQRSMDDGRTCQMQVCRYHKPGNCGLDQNNWLNEMLKDDTRCVGSPVYC